MFLCGASDIKSEKDSQLTLFAREQKQLEEFMRQLNDPNQKAKYNILQKLELWIFGDSAEDKYGMGHKKETKKSNHTPPKLDESRLEILLLGSESHSGAEGGLCALCEVKLKFFTFSKSKRSSELALIIIWRLIYENNFKYRKDAQSVFSGFESSYFL